MNGLIEKEPASKGSFLFAALFALAMLLTPLAALAQVQYCVSGAGDPGFNGTYSQSEEDENHFVHSDGSHIIYSNFEARWTISASLEENQDGYAATEILDPGVGPEEAVYETVTGPDFSGTDPAPQVTAGACAEPTPTPTVTPTPTLTPTATPTPDIIPNKLCFSGTVSFDGEDLDTNPDEGSSRTIEGELFGGGTRQAFVYSPNGDFLKVGNSFTFRYLLGAGLNPSLYGGGPVFQLNEAGKVGVKTTYVPITSGQGPEGTYSLSVSCGSSCAGDQYEIDVFECGTEPLHIRNIPKGSIAGRVNRASQAVVAARDIPNLSAGDIYALLFLGSGPTDPSARPEQALIVEEDGSYRFDNVTPGDYHVLFKGADTTFSPELVDVSLVGSGTATAPDADAVQAAYNDAGCKVTSTAMKIFAVDGALLTLRNHLSAIASGNSSLATGNKPGKERERLARAFERRRARYDTLYARIMQASKTYPLQVRTNCPAANACESRTFSMERRLVSKALRQMKLTADRVQSLSLRSFPSKANLRKTRSAARRTAKLYRRSLKAVSALPQKEQRCPTL